MAQKALFITINDLKRKSIIDGNVDADKLIQFIEVAQDTHIQNYLSAEYSDRQSYKSRFATANIIIKLIKRGKENFLSAFLANRA